VSAIFSQESGRPDRPVVIPGEAGAAPVPPLGPTRSTEDESFESQDAALALELLRAMADQDFARAERFGSRARNAFALAAGFFAVTQAVVFGSFASSEVSRGETEALLYLGGLAGVLLACAGLLVLAVERARVARNLTPDTVIDVLNEEGGEEGRVVDRFVELYAKFVATLRETNELRLKRASWVQTFVSMTILVTLIELAVGFLVRR
jgi:hypothetical protein